jgi:hypothetical protein
VAQKAYGQVKDELHRQTCYRAAIRTLYIAADNEIIALCMNLPERRKITRIQPFS